MENGTRCPLKQALFRVQSSAKSPQHLIDALCLLQKLISNLLNHRSDWRYTILDKENDLSAHQLLQWDEVRQFLVLLGFREENGAYEYEVSDEGMKAVEAALKVLNTTINSLKATFTEERPYFELWKDGHYVKNSRILTSNMNHCNKTVESTKSRGAKLEGLLARHLKQDVFERDALVNWKKRQVPDASSFNSEGYFYQACQKKDIKKRKCFYEEMFEKHDFNNHKKDFSFFPSLKLG